MKNSDENSCHPAITKSGPFFKSPVSKSFDQGIDTPQKYPTAPHPSPINMDAESSDPKWKEMFRTELLKACLLKIPEVLTDKSIFNDCPSPKPSSTSEDSISESADGPPGQCFLRVPKKAKLETEWIAKNGHLTDSYPISNVNQSPGSLNPSQYSNFCKVSFEGNPNECTSANVNDLCGKSECSRKVHSFCFGNNGMVGSPCININIVESIEKKDGTEPFPSHEIDRVAFYDHTTDHKEISRLLNVNSDWKEHPDSNLGGRSPCSDDVSMVAVCDSDASDISDEEISTMSVDLPDMGKSVDCLSNFGKKKSKSVVSRFLNWRRSLKIRKRAASLDESKFPILANRFDSYKTEFELTV